MNTSRRLLTALTPPAVALVPVLSLWSRNAGEVDASVVAAPLGLAAGLGVITWIVFWLVLRRGSAAAALASGFLILFFSYGYGIQVLIGYGLRLNQADAVVITLCLFLIAAAAYAVKRFKLDWIVLVLGVAAAAMLVMSGAELWMRRAEPAGSPDSNLFVKRFAPTDPGNPSPPLRRDSPETPDIYYIILDGYARHDVLQTGFDHDNTRFLANLEKRGFYVARESNSNYARTPLSLATSLNGVYMDGVIDAIGGSTARAPFYRLLRNNWVGRFLRARGYRYAQIYTNWSGTETSEIADLDYRFRPRQVGSEFAYVLLGTTALHRLRPTVADFHLFGLDAIKRLSDVEGPTFLFAHLLLPHDPYVFGRDGTVRAEVPLDLHHHLPTKRVANGPDPVQSYVDQLVFLNGEILKVIDYLQKSSSVPPVVIIQGDHGWNSFPSPSLSAAQRRSYKIRERVGILNTLLVPESVERRLYPGITPVNTFRLLFAELFGADLELLPDRTYYSEYAAELDFEDVTGLIRQPQQSER